MQIAMWSGPRNLSTALMYSFGARPDFDIVDEPFYGTYLALTGAHHPMRDEILAAMECAPERVASEITAPEPQHRYVKHMTHHMVEGVPRDWFGQVQHAFLIRHPARVVASYAAKREKPTLADLGFAAQLDIFLQVQSLGLKPVVIDSFDIRAAPGASLKKLCGALGLDWDASMLSWPPGGHSADGVWARHWYGAVHASSGFAAPEGPLPTLSPAMQDLAEAALPAYERLAAEKL